MCVYLCRTPGIWHKSKCHNNNSNKHNISLKHNMYCMNVYFWVQLMTRYVSWSPMCDSMYRVFYIYVFAQMCQHDAFLDEIKRVGTQPHTHTAQPHSHLRLKALSRFIVEAACPFASFPSHFIVIIYNIRGEYFQCTDIALTHTHTHTQRRRTENKTIHVYT